MNVDLRQILDTANVTYLLLVIVFLLMYIAFKEPRKSRKTR